MHRGLRRNEPRLGPVFGALRTLNTPSPKTLFQNHAEEVAHGGYWDELRQVKIRCIAMLKNKPQKKKIV